jgi:SAM-dependent methyltransferase
MQSNQEIDSGRPVDWGKTAGDYARHRPGPPDSFYKKLRDVRVGLPNQRFLDLGTGTGALARRFAAQGCNVIGIDISLPSLTLATKQIAPHDVRYVAARAEALPFREARFDFVIASQCWLYFDKAVTLPEVQRVLAPGGVLVTSHLNFMPRLDAIVKQSEELVLRYNPDWTGGDWHGVVPEQPEWSRGVVTVQARLCYDEAIWFTREEWRGRMRALRGIGASLSSAQVEAFDRDHDALLQRIAPDRFPLTHRIDAHVFVF